MKKSLLLAVAAAACATTLTAGVNRHRPVVDRMATAAARVAAPAVNRPTTADLTDVTTITDWKSIGTGRYVDGIISQPYGTDETADYTQYVEIEESEANPGVYRLVDPYRNHPYVYDDEFDWDNTHYMILDARDPKAVTMPEFYTGVIIDGDESQQVYAKSFGNGAFEDGVITFPEWALAYRFPDVAYAVCNWRSTFRVYMPWVPDYELSINAEECLNNAETATIEFTAGKDVAKLKYSLVMGQPADLAANFADAAASGINIELDSSSFEITLSDYGVYTLAVVAFDQDGNEQKTASAIFYNNRPAEDDLWEDAGTCTIKELIPGSFFTTFTESTVDVAFQQHKTTKGLYRLINPLATTPAGTYYDGYYSHTKDFDHYIVINATDPDRVYVEESATGLNLGYGPLMFSSQAAVEAAKGNYISELDAGMFGKLDHGTIILPDSTLLVGMLDYNNGKYYHAEGDFVMVMPTEHTVTIASNCDSRFGSVAFTSPEATGNKLTTTETTVTIKATPAEGIEFGGWADSEGNILTFSDEYSYLGSKDATFTANFTASVAFANGKNYTISVASGETLLKSGETVAPGSTLKVTVVPAKGFKCTGLKVNDTTLDGNGEFDVVVEKASELEAVIEADDCTFALTVAGSGIAQAWPGMAADGQPEGTEIATGSTVKFGDFVYIYLFPAKKADGTYNTVLGVNVTTDDESRELTVGEEVWESEWKSDEKVMIADITIKGNTAVEVTFSTDPTSIDAIGEDNAPAEYFTLQGVRVNATDLSSGIYLMRRGATTSKVVIR